MAEPVMDEIIFTSTAFPVLPNEDEAINPGIFGRSVADWIKKSLTGTKFEITEDINEDFGYCLIVHRTPYWLWVGCCGYSDHPYDEGALDESVAASLPLASIEWRVWVTTEWGVLSKLLRRDNRIRDQHELLDILRDKLSALPHVVFREDGW